MSNLESSNQKTGDAMHENNINRLRDEAQRQIERLKEILLDAHGKGLISESSSKQKNRATLDTQSLQKWLDALDGENTKLENLEMVLAVVGTMKAGKSTTINAIAGAEVMPNRNRPMTTLPTLIRHTPGVLVPKLSLENVAPLNSLLAEIKKLLSSNNSNVLQYLGSDNDLSELLEQIKSGEGFVGQHEGDEQIFRFLKNLNDLARLCFALDEVEFPFSEYSSVETMPVIEIEFSHLKHLSAAQGQLTLLDTPGPNEAGQQHLRRMLEEQLGKASAVLAVLDYTQLKSDSDEALRNQLLDISRINKDRLYVLVNKFDQKDRNSDDASATKKHVNQLLRGEVSDSHIFPVSSQQGYLASRARNEIERNGKLPKGEAWLDDFGQLVLGAMWSPENAEDKESMDKVSRRLWEKSGFSEPLERVIIRAHKNAALGALRSATSKIRNYAQEAGDYFNASVGALKKSVDELKKSIDVLEKDIEEVEFLEGQARQTLDEILDEVLYEVREEADKVKRGIWLQLDAYFKEGKSRERQVLENAPVPAKKKRKSSAKSSQEKDFDPNNPVIRFDSKSEASDFLERIDKSVRELLMEGEHGMQRVIGSGVESFLMGLAELREDSLEKIRASVQKNIEGFDINICLPDARSISLDTSVSGILADAVYKKTRTVTRSRRQTGLWGKICGWFNTDDWGWEDYKVDEDYFEVSIEVIRKSTEAAMGSLFDAAEEVMEKQVRPQLEAGMGEFFSVFKEKIEHVRGDLIKGIENHKESQDVQSRILLQSKSMASKIMHLFEDSEELDDETSALLMQEDMPGGIP